MIFNNSKKEIGRLTERIYNVEEENKKLIRKIYNLEEENEYLKTISNLNRFYADACLNINNNNKYLDALEKINKFYLINDLKSKGISNKDIYNHIKGKSGEKYLLSKFNEYIKDNRKLEYFYDFNIQNEFQNLQFDFLAIAKNNIYIIEVKNLSAKEIELCKSGKGDYYIKPYYRSNNSNDYVIKFGSMFSRYKLIEGIIEKFQDKYRHISFNVFNIMVFIENKEILKIENYNDVLALDYNINVPMANSKGIQILLGKENIDGYFKNYTSKIYKKDCSKEEGSILDDFTKFIKSDISFRESTDKNYIIQRVYEFFDQVYKCVERENLNLKFDD